MKEDAHYNLYVLAEIAYQKEHQDLDKNELFPADWYSINDYKSKVEIIAEALNNKCLVVISFPTETHKTIFIIIIKNALT